MRALLLRFAFLFLFACCYGLQATAQYTHTNDMEARPMHEYNTITMDGSPYLHPEWTKGVLTLKNGTMYQGIELMFDQVKDAVVFKTKDGQVRELLEPVQEFKINYVKNNQHVEHTFRTGYTGEGITPKAFLEVLSDGNATLLKRTSKKIFDRKGYSSATINREVQVAEEYYIAIDNKAVKIKKTKGSILAAIPDKSDALSAYIKSNSLLLRNDSDLVKLVGYYNSL